jgi:aspartyl-tRNA(Asn)/glutamyl-tRNA(Gln) amidotransferase subunit B
MQQFHEWEAVIGLEVHIQLLTQSKLFSGASTAYGAPANTLASAIDLAMPGTLPVLNQEAVRMAVMFGLSVQAQIPEETIFARKHYFYPDLPKGYQISQHEHPIVGSGGYLTIETEEGEAKNIRITRAHLEEDAGKSLHEGFEAMSSVSGIDLNRAGVPLLEIVSEPDLRSAKEAVSYLKKLHTLVRYLNICDGNMQEGSFRCDANVSVRKRGDTKLGIRAELKNLNSFRYIEKAINFEIERQIQAIDRGEKLYTETRLYDAALNETRGLRAKEAVADYRYFPDPDLCPLPLTPAFIEEVRKQLPELPDQKCIRFQTQYQLSAYDAAILTADKTLADYFENIVSFQIDPKLAANWVNGELAAALNKEKCDIENNPISAVRFADLLRRVSDGTLSRSMAKDVFEQLWLGLENVDTYIKQHNLEQLTDESAIENLIEALLKDYPKQVEAYRGGKDKLFGFFVGQAMQRSKGRCHPSKLNDILKRKLDNVGDSTH